MAQLVGKTISHFKILHQFDQGGMGIVYKALDQKLDRIVALKFLNPDLNSTDEGKNQFIIEAKSASSLQHHNICTIHEIDETSDGNIFICMDYYEGENLKKKIEHGPLSEKEAIHIAIQIAQGLKSAHHAGIVHRDIKPSNIIITSEGEVKILDFGLAKLLEKEKFITEKNIPGTIEYMSPEQIQGHEIDHRSDIWSLGIVLYQMLTGKLPFQGEINEEIIYSILNEEPPNIKEAPFNFPNPLNTLIQKCLQVNPVDRFQSIEEFSKELHKFGSSLIREKFESEKHKFQRKLKKGFLFSLIIILMFILILLIYPSSRKQIIDHLVRSKIPEEKHLAVLPFSKIGSEPLIREFCDGLVETITSKLTQLEDFRGTLWVVPLSEVRQLDILNAKMTRKRFGASLALTGSVQQNDDRIRLTINLVSTKELRQLRSFVNDYNLGNIIALQDQIVKVIIDMLEIELNPQKLVNLKAGGTSISDAYIYYNRGLAYLQRYEKEENLDMASELFQQAIKDDSLYALAYTALGETYWRKYEATRDTNCISEAILNCQKAIYINKNLSAVHITLGIIYNGTGKFEEAQNEFKTVLKYEPANSMAYLGLAKSYEALQKLDDAEKTYQKAIESKPDYWAGHNAIGVFYYHYGRFEESAEQFLKVTKLTPDNTRAFNNLGGIYIMLKEFKKAEKAFNRSIEIEPNYGAYSNLGTLYFYEKNRYQDAINMFNKALKLQNNDYRVWASLASAYLAVDEKYKADSVYQRAIEKAESEYNINPKDGRVLSHLASFYAMIGYTNKANTYSIKSLKLSPDDIEVLTRSIETLEKIGKRKEATVWIKKALKRGYSLKHFTDIPVLKKLLDEENLDN